MKRRIFVSDTHMTLGASLGTNHEYEWFDKDDARNLLDFLNFLQTYQFDELILLGDIMDDWLYPFDMRPPSYDDIAKAAHVSPILQALRQIALQRGVTYVQGNHDMSIMNPNLQAFLSTQFARIKFQTYYETGDGIFAQHGHQYLMWNGEDPVHLAPIGYYITRLLVAVDQLTPQMTYTIPEIAGTLIHSGTPEQGLVNAPIEFLRFKLNELTPPVTDSKPIVDVPGMPSLTVGGVKTAYAGLPKAWANVHHDPKEPWESVFREINGLFLVASRMAWESSSTARPKKVIIFGHTHTEYIRPMETIAGPDGDTISSVRYGIYANCGCWCDNNDPKKKPYSYVVTESDGTGKHKVTLNNWPPQKNISRWSREYVI